MKLKKLFTLLIISITICIYACSAQGQMPDSVKTYIDSAIYFMESKSLYGKGLNWKKIRDSAYIKASAAKTYTEAFPALVYAFNHLKDDHGMVANNDTFYRYPAHVNFDSILSPGLKKEFLKGIRIVTNNFDNSIAYLRVPSVIANRQNLMDEKANQLRDSLCMLLSRNPKALIIDLRVNGGGNAAPMLTGVSPLFDNSLLGYYVDRDGKFVDTVQMKDGVIVDENGNKTISIKNSCTSAVKLPIAVLLGPNTSSSGEILAAFLSRQKNVKTFGESTGSFCNSTQGFLFANEQGYLLLSVNRVADAGKKIYREGFVKPDIFIKNQDNYDNLLKDPVVTAAISWIQKRNS